jgi:hypothetical protein
MGSMDMVALLHRYLTSPSCDNGCSENLTLHRASRGRDESLYGQLDICICFITTNGTEGILCRTTS